MDIGQSQEVSGDRGPSIPTLRPHHHHVVPTYSGRRIGNLRTSRTMTEALTDAFFYFPRRPSDPSS
jgi:uncharacterized protein (DUF427 family)